MKKKTISLLLLLLIVSLAVCSMVYCVVFVPFDVQMTWLARNYYGLESWIAHNYLMGALAFTAVSLGVILLLLPFGIALCVFGGVFFGTAAGSIYLLISYTISAAVIFQIVRSTFGKNTFGYTARKHQRYYERFRENSFYYLLFLRIFPFTPFWLISVLAGLSPMRFVRYMLATLIGTIFPTLIYVDLGTRINQFLASGGSLSDYCRANSSPVIILLVISFVTLLPVLLKKRFARRELD
jgi:uncharacterized membrane protein YdjX (TVP38/TMEM64 family)